MKNMEAALQTAYSDLFRDKRVSEIVGDLLVDINRISSGIVDILADGFGFDDLTKIAALVPEFMKIVENIQGLSGDAKRSLVRDIVLTVYVALDRGESGKENNIDIPIVFGPIERVIEYKLIDFVAFTAVDALHKYMESKGDI